MSVLQSLGDRVTYVIGDLELLDRIALDRTDVVVSSRALHHFSPESLSRIYRRVHELLVPGGFFFNLDHVGAPGDWEQRYRRIRAQFAGRPQAGAETAPARLSARSRRGSPPLGRCGRLRGSRVAWRMLYSALVAARRPA